jgi:hypothetical protein
LDNAACRHEALLKFKPHNRGLANALANLRANAERRAAREQRRRAHDERSSSGS